MKEEEPPSSLGGAVLSAPIPSTPKKRRPWRERIWKAVAILTVLGTIAFGIMGFVRESSFDLPIPGSRVRPGFHENGWFHRWTCPKDHDHWSAPYWSGTVFLIIATSLVARRAWKRRSGTTVHD